MTKSTPVAQLLSTQTATREPIKLVQLTGVDLNLVNVACALGTKWVSPVSDQVEGEHLPLDLQVVQVHEGGVAGL